MIWSCFPGRFLHFSLLGVCMGVLVGCSSKVDRQPTNVVLCARNAQYECFDSQLTFSANTADIMVNAGLENVLEQTQITVQWTYLDGELGQPVEIDSTIFEKTDGGVISMYAILSRPDNGWPQGDYEVVLSSDENNVEPVIVPFAIAAGRSSRPDTLTSSASPSGTGVDDRSRVDDSSTAARSVDILDILDNVTLCQLNEQDDCVTEMAVMPTSSPGVRVKANVSTAPVGTTVEAKWRYIEGSLGRPVDIETVSLTKQNDAITWIQSSLKKPEGGWPTGRYEVALTSASDSAVPETSTSDNFDIAVKRFFVQ